MIIEVFEDTSPLAKRNLDNLPDEVLDMIDAAYNAAVVELPDMSMISADGFDSNG